ncbi:MAG: nitroreductase/quinone reductase family protein [Polyangiales bacterium]
MSTKANKSYFTPGPKLLKFITDAHVTLYEKTNGAVGSTVFQLGEEGHFLLRPYNILLLTTKGKKTGLERKVTLPFFQYDDRIYLFASNSAQEKNPAWFVNLKATPSVRVQIGALHMQATARILEGEEYVQLWKRHSSLWPRWAVYQTQTTRRIPIVELVPG